MRGIALAYAALPAGKRRTFRKALAERGITAARLPIVALADAPIQAPLSFARERLWFLWRLNPASAAYNISTAVHLTGRLSVPAVRAAIDALVARHDALRTRFVEQDGSPSQVLDPALMPEWEEIDATGADSRDAMPMRLAEHAEPAVRSGARSAAACGAFGGWATPSTSCSYACTTSFRTPGPRAILVREFADCYRDAVADRAPAAPPSGIGYREYALWQREWHDDRTLKTQENYWRKRPRQRASRIAAAGGPQARRGAR